MLRFLYFQPFYFPLHSYFFDSDTNQYQLRRHCIIFLYFSDKPNVGANVLFLSQYLHLHLN